MEPLTHPKKKSTDKSRLNFYGSMKDKIMNAVDYMTIEETSEFIDKDTSMQKIKTLNNLVVNSSVGVIKGNCMLGIELANLKYTYFVEFCERCRESDDKYNALFCACCPHLALNTVGIKQFFKFCGDNLSKSSKPWINFLLKVGKLGKQYPKFKNVNISMHELKKNISWLPSYMEEDKEFWND